ncbi:MAG: YggS family pyridoxal phosphate-dependent enzyme [Candidatus Kapabacteria bacterium]|nr:YggS family pyridoxal phosphate-dependent enzyme [Candidatus Kapabacteria bacterium]
MTTSTLAQDLRTRYQAILGSAHEAAIAAGRLPNTVRVLAVSKTQPIETIHAALEAEITAFGENYAQEFRDKASRLTSDALIAEWHFIGHLQTNKVKMIAPYVSCIHSVDSARLAQEISKAASALGKTIDVLLQVNTSGEESKSGCEPHEIYALAEAALKEPNIRVRGLMTIAAFSDDAEFVRPMFRSLRSLRDELRTRFPEASFDELSMGMSGDYAAAIQEGSTMIRVGTAIFGEREKKN